jgi:hypothetical protein
VTVAASTAPAFLTGLRTKLQARAALSGVAVHLVSPPDMGVADTIVLIWARVDGLQEPAALGKLRRRDGYTVPGLVRTYRAAGAAGAQDSDAVWQAAHERAAALLGEVADQVFKDPPAAGDQTETAHVEDNGFVPVPGDNGGWFCEWAFSVVYRARVT